MDAAGGVGAQEDVGGLEVAVDHALGVGVPYSVEHAAKQALGLDGVGWGAVDQVFEGAAVDELHQQAGRAVDIEDVGDGDDPGVGEPRLEHALLHEAIGDAAVPAGEDLQRVGRAEGRVAHEQHDGETAPTELLDHLVAVDHRSGRHRVSSGGP